ncbi:hypothetical protein B7R54_19390 [Subtercola boreus]|uniref:Uncharacterized protein n=1 Tax=Subtercola boreus TaxID=120213 RepID=A0A3E0VB00_9MICO|nr:hypothetical protein [Subtercola boreus]RFA06530.1 hypothetical protein B7R54_19390 [Subtercola boreus]TQL46829.1 hypothetical protein FB464_3821 [Subtercola boreus]
MNPKKLIPVIVIAAAVIAGLVFWQVSTAGTSAPSSQSQPTGAAAVLPVTTNPIQNTSTAPGLTIVTAAVQDNTDPQTQAAISDRLQITVKNTGTAALTGFEVFYTMKDTVTNAAESYYQKLDEAPLMPGASTTINFDNQSGPGHYPENMFSLYRSSKNKVEFSIEVSASGAATAHATAVKDAGNGEKSD